MARSNLIVRVAASKNLAFYHNAAFSARGNEERIIIRETRTNK